MTFKIKRPKTKENKTFFRIKNHKSLYDLKKEIRENGFKDYFKVNGVIYTQDNYDMGGQEVSYGNKRTKTGFIVHTKDRYKIGTKDAEIEYLDSSYLRKGISYID